MVQVTFALYILIKRLTVFFYFFLTSIHYVMSLFQSNVGSRPVQSYATLIELELLCCMSNIKINEFIITFNHS